ncbi:MAG: hypothetical protein GEU83_08545 [Pseudonocardiaceae bacterium]|nr:hypothetical protein [Pseudonocardiaceae bacterium]
MTVEHVVDLTGHEHTSRRAAVLAAADDYDPAAALDAEQQQATAMLYSGLDEQQQAIYDELVDAGVLAGPRG